MLPGAESIEDTRYNTAMHAIEAVSMKIEDLGFANFAFGWNFWIAIELDSSNFSHFDGRERKPEIFMHSIFRSSYFIPRFFLFFLYIFVFPG